MTTPISFKIAKLLKEKDIKIDTEQVLFYRDEVNNIEEHQIKNRDVLYNYTGSTMNIKRWYKRKYCILSIEECKEMNLIPSFNLYGDAINMFNCRSFWKDEKGRLYRCKHLIPINKSLEM